MKTAMKLEGLRLVIAVLALPASCSALAADTRLGTVFYSPAERAEIVAARNGNGTTAGGTPAHYSVSGLIKREGGKSVAWINGQPVVEKPQQAGTPAIRVFRDGVLIDGKPAKVGETLNAASGERSSALPADAVTVRK